jgi:hypothetical protein
VLRDLYRLNSFLSFSVFGGNEVDLYMERGDNQKWGYKVHCSLPPSLFLSLSLFSRFLFGVIHLSGYRLLGLTGLALYLVNKTLG